MTAAEGGGDADYTEVISLSPHETDFSTLNICIEDMWRNSRSFVVDEISTAAELVLRYCEEAGITSTPDPSEWKIVRMRDDNSGLYNVRVRKHIPLSRLSRPLMKGETLVIVWNTMLGPRGDPPFVERNSPIDKEQGEWSSQPVPPSN